MAAPGVVTDCIASFDRLFALAEAGADVTVAMEALAREVRAEARQRGDLAAIIAGVELAAALSTPMDHPETPAERFLTRAAALLRLADPPAREFGDSLRIPYPVVELPPRLANS